MARWTWLAVAGWLAAVPAEAQPPTADADPVVAVTFQDQEGKLGKWSAEAQTLVTNIFKAAGVTVTWDPADAATADRSLTVTMTTAKGWSVSGQAMGVAPSPGDGTRGTQAYVFGDRLSAFANRYGVPPAFVLACAMAHELGHLLLPPNAHGDRGLMRESWDPSLLPPKSPGIQGFLPAQARLLRLRSRRLAAAPQPVRPSGKQ